MQSRQIFGVVCLQKLKWEESKPGCSLESSFFFPNCLMCPKNPANPLMPSSACPLSPLGRRRRREVGGERDKKRTNKKNLLTCSATGLHHEVYVTYCYGTIWKPLYQDQGRHSTLNTSPFDISFLEKKLTQVDHSIWQVTWIDSAETFCKLKWYLSSHKWSNFWGSSCKVHPIHIFIHCKNIKTRTYWLFRTCKNESFRSVCFLCNIIVIVY